MNYEELRIGNSEKVYMSSESHSLPNTCTVHD